MRRVHFERHAFSLTPLSPIHVGTGETIEPYEYDLSGQKVRHLVAYDLDALLSHLTEAQRREFFKLTDSANVVALRAWFRQLPNRDQFRRFGVVLGGKAATEIAQNLDNPCRLGEIHLLPRHLVTGLCYLPGSSVKGAIRTALVDSVARRPETELAPLLEIRADANRNKAAGVRFEAAVLGNQKPDGWADLYRDPFRQIAVTDLEVPKDGTFIDRIQIRKLSQRPSEADPGGIVMYREVTRAAIYGEPQSLPGELRLHPELCDPQVMGSDRDGRPNVLPQRFPLHSVIQMCNAFYRPRMQSELQSFVKDQNQSKIHERLQAAMDTMADHECLIRLGRHSHFECMTLGDPYHVPPQRGFGATESFVGGLVPLGWAKLSFGMPAIP